MKTTYILAVLISFVALDATATNNDNKIICEYTDSTPNNFQTKYESLKALSLEVGPLLCKHILLVDEEEKAKFERALFDYAALAKKVIQTSYPDNSFPGINNITEQWESQLKNYSMKLDYVNRINFVWEDAGRDAVDNRFIIRVKLPPNNESNLVWGLRDEQESICKKTSFDMSCKQVAQNLNSALKPAFSLLNTAIAKKNGELLSALQNDWKQFIKDARYQTPLDVWATTALQSDYFDGTDLVGPPAWQAFLLRPSIVYEHINELEKGDKNDVSLALEWAGINWWKKGFGFSLTSVYNDRKETDSIGHGLTIHIKNKYSVGYVHRSDGNGSIFFNIDLFEFFGENKDVYKKYKEYL
jgi:hypothetical protein